MEVTNETDNATNQFGATGVFFKLTADKYVASVTQWLVFTAAIIGNGLILLLAVHKKIQASKVSLFLICSLAVADLLQTIGSTWTEAIVDIIPSWLFGQVWCKIHTYTKMVTCNASIGILVVIAIERFIQVVTPQRGKMSIRVAISLVTYIWIHVLATNIPFLVWNGLVPTGPGLVRCSQRVNANPKTMAIYSIIMCVLNFFIPLVITWTSYIAILCKMWASRKKVAAHGGGSSSVQHKPVAHKATVMCVLVVLTFTITWTPMLILPQVGMFKGFRSVAHLIRPFDVLTLMSTAINPIIYGFLWEPFRLAMRKLCGCTTPEDESSAMTGMSTVKTQLVTIPAQVQ